jgi:hypothetical protein
VGVNQPAVFAARRPPREALSLLVRRCLPDHSRAAPSHNHLVQAYCQCVTAVVSAEPVQWPFGTSMTPCWKSRPGRAPGRCELFGQRAAGVINATLTPP